MTNGPTSADQPPPQNPHRGTPRSLSQTLRRIREEGTSRSQAWLARELRVSAALVRKWERPEDPEYSIKFRDLERFQDLYGVPVGIIVCVSQILADARDNNDDRLRVMAGMLDALLHRIDTAEKREDVIGRVHKNYKDPKRTTYADWDNLLGILWMSVWSSVPDKLLETYKNKRRLSLRAR